MMCLFVLFIVIQPINHAYHSSILFLQYFIHAFNIHRLFTYSHLIQQYSDSSSISSHHSITTNNFTTIHSIQIHLLLLLSLSIDYQDYSSNQLKNSLTIPKYHTTHTQQKFVISISITRQPKLEPQKATESDTHGANYRLRRSSIQWLNGLRVWQKYSPPRPRC